MLNDPFAEFEAGRDADAGRFMVFADQVVRPPLRARMVVQRRAPMRTSITAGGWPGGALCEDRAADRQQAHSTAPASAPRTIRTSAPRRPDFRILLDQPKGHVAPHSHAVQEQICHIRSGDAVMELDDRRFVVGPQDTVFIPPGVRHTICNTGLTDLVFYVITSPPEDTE